jgi:acyl-CoA thioester hydrolase
MFESKIRVRYEETDQMGHAYYAKYLVWFEIGRTDLMRFLGHPYSGLEEKGVLLPVLEANAKYMRGARYDELLTLGSWIREIGRASIAFGYRIKGEKGDLVCTGGTTHAFIGRDGKILRRGLEFLEKLRPHVEILE